MGTESKVYSDKARKQESKANLQRQIDIHQRSIDSLRADNARDRESIKNNKGNKSFCESRKISIKSRDKQIKYYQDCIKDLRKQKASIK